MNAHFSQMYAITENAPKPIYVDFSHMEESTEAAAARVESTLGPSTHRAAGLGGLRPACARPSVRCGQHHLSLIRLC